MCMHVLVHVWYVHRGLVFVHMYMVVWVVVVVCIICVICVHAHICTWYVWCVYMCVHMCIWV